MKAILPWALILFVGPLTAAQPDVRASAMADTCRGCHGAGQALPLLADRTLADNTLADKKPGEIAQQLLAFKSGERIGTLMNRIARGYTDAELINIAEVLEQP